MRRLLLLLMLVCTVGGATGAQAQAPQSSQQSKEEGTEVRVVADGSEEAVVGRMGSRPPSCERKCGRCTPCAAIQVPATSDRLGPQYANYEPEGWKCKCGALFFNP